MSRVTELPTPKEISLAGAGWELSSSPGIYRVPARVPNDIADDLERAGLLPDLFYGTNSMFAANWTINRTWTLSRTVAVPPLAAGGTALLLIQGCDYHCSVSVNGQELLTHKGAFEPFEVDVTRALGASQRLALAVTLHPPPPAVTWPLYGSAWPAGWGADQCAWNREMRPWKSRLVYIADNKGTINMAAKHWARGLWRNASLRLLPSPARLHRQMAVSATLDGDARAGVDDAFEAVKFDAASAAVVTAAATARVQVQWLGGNGGAAVAARELRSSYRLHVELRCTTDATAPQATAEVDLGGGAAAPLASGWSLSSLDVTVPEARLWWPNGYGTAHLYEATATLLVCPRKAQTAAEAAACEVVDIVVEASFGFRRLEVRRDEIDV